MTNPWKADRSESDLLPTRLHCLSVICPRMSPTSFLRKLSHSLVWLKGQSSSWMTAGALLEKALLSLQPNQQHERLSTGAAMESSYCLRKICFIWKFWSLVKQASRFRCGYSGREKKIKSLPSPGPLALLLLRWWSSLMMKMVCQRSLPRRTQIIRSEFHVSALLHGFSSVCASFIAQGWSCSKVCKDYAKSFCRNPNIIFMDFLFIQRERAASTICQAWHLWVWILTTMEVSRWHGETAEAAGGKKYPWGPWQAGSRNGRCLPWAPS